MAVDVKVEIVTITPSEALVLLEGNTTNRTVRQSRVAQYARDMKNKQWKLNGDPIRLNGTGTLMDGQHRLLACVLADTSFETVVVTGVSNAAHVTIDTGAARTLGDELRYRGEKNVNNLSSGLNLVWNYDNDTVGKGNMLMSRTEGTRLLQKEPGIRDAVSAASKVAKNQGIMDSALIAASHILQREHGIETMLEFLSHLDAGVDYQPNDPCLMLRQYVVRAHSSRMFRPRREEWFAIIVKAMNAWLLGRPIKNLMWRRVGPKAEGFPRLLSRDDF